VRTGVILAGGASTRFGSDKAFARWEGETFLARVARAVAPHVDELLVLARAGSDPAGYVHEAPGAIVLPDRRSGEGPVAALRDALPAIRGERIVVAACDAPGLTAEAVASLAAHERAILVDAAGDPCMALVLPAAALRERLASATRLMDLAVGARRVASALRGLDEDAPR
jgi:molybdopterin-guanine dinucleotide biosynthesis protein A